MNYHLKSRDNFYQRYYKHSPKLKKLRMIRKPPKRFYELPMQLYNQKNNIIIRMTKQRKPPPFLDRLSMQLYENTMRYIRKVTPRKKKDYNYIVYQNKTKFLLPKKVSRCRRLGCLMEEQWGHKVDSNVYLNPHVMVWCIPRKNFLPQINPLILHRTNGPAVIFKNGNTEWWINGKNVTEKISSIITTHEMDEDYRNWTDGDHIILRFALS